MGGTNKLRRLMDKSIVYCVEVSIEKSKRKAKRIDAIITMNRVPEMTLSRITVSRAKMTKWEMRGSEIATL